MDLDPDVLDELAPLLEYLGSVKEERIPLEQLPARLRDILCLEVAESLHLISFCALGYGGRVVTAEGPIGKRPRMWKGRREVGLAGPLSQAIQSSLSRSDPRERLHVELRAAGRAALARLAAKRLVTRSRDPSSTTGPAPVHAGERFAPMQNALLAAEPPQRLPEIQKLFDGIVRVRCAVTLLQIIYNESMSIFETHGAPEADEWPAFADARKRRRQEIERLERESLRKAGKSEAFFVAHTRWEDNLIELRDAYLDLCAAIQETIDAVDPALAVRVNCRPAVPEAWFLELRSRLRELAGNVHPNGRAGVDGMGFVRLGCKPLPAGLAEIMRGIEEKQKILYDVSVLVEPKGPPPGTAGSEEDVFARPDRIEGSKQPALPAGCTPGTPPLVVLAHLFEALATDARHINKKMDEYFDSDGNTRPPRRDREAVSPEQLEGFLKDLQTLEQQAQLSKQWISYNREALARELGGGASGWAAEALADVRTLVDWIGQLAGLSGLRKAGLGIDPIPPASPTDPVASPSQASQILQVIAQQLDERKDRVSDVHELTRYHGVTPSTQRSAGSSPDDDRNRPKVVVVAVGKDQVSDHDVLLGRVRAAYIEAGGNVKDAIARLASDPDLPITVPQSSFYALLKKLDQKHGTRWREAAISKKPGNAEKRGSHRRPGKNRGQPGSR